MAIQITIRDKALAAVLCAATVWTATDSYAQQNTAQFDSTDQNEAAFEGRLSTSSSIRFREMEPTQPQINEPVYATKPLRKPTPLGMTPSEPFPSKNHEPSPLLRERSPSTELPQSNADHFNPMRFADQPPEHADFENAPVQQATLRQTPARYTPIQQDSVQHAIEASGAGQDQGRRNGVYQADPMQMDRAATLDSSETAVDVVRAAYKRATGVVDSVSSRAELSAQSERELIRRLKPEASTSLSSGIIERSSDDRQATFSRANARDGGGLYETERFEGERSDAFAANAPSKESFISREKKDSETAPSAAMQTVTRIGLNLLFVLAAAVGVILLIKTWFQSKGKVSAVPSSDNLTVVQVLPLANGSALHVVDGFQKRFLIAVDSSGIKSVEMLGANFEDVMERTQADLESDTKPIQDHGRRARRERQDAPSTGPSFNVVDSSQDIDRQLMQLLLRGGNNAA